MEGGPKEIQNNDIEEYQGNRMAEQSQVLKILENYITDDYDRPNRPETLEFEPEVEGDTDEKGKVKWKKLSSK